MMDHIIPIDDARVPIPKGTLYQWHSKGVYPGLIIKIKGKLYFDLNEWSYIIEAAKRGEKHGDA